ncbi:MAG: BatA domain-containing protein [Phycisphaerales bacterium]
MSFLHPGLAIAGVLAISIPIIIHLLFRQRRRPVVWAAMRFLIEAYKKQRRRLQLEQLMLLILRCLVVLLLALAIARPLLTRAGLLGGLSGGRTVVLLIDNSLAAQTPDSIDGSSDPAIALDRHKSSAKELLGTLSPNDRVALITLARPARAIVLPASSDLDAIGRLIDEIPPTDAPADLPGAVPLIAGVHGAEESGAPQPVSVALLSDFLRGSAELSAALPGIPGADETTMIIATTPRPAPGANTQVVSINPLRAVSLDNDRSPEAGQRSIQARIELRRTGDDLSSPHSVPVRASAVRIDGRPAGPVVSTRARFEPGADTASVGVRIPIDPEDAGDASVRRGASADIIRVAIDDDSIAGDDVALHVLPRREALRVVVIAQRRFGGLPSPDRLAPADWLRLAAQPAEQAPVEVLDLEPAAVDRAALRGLDAALVPRPDLLSDTAWLALREFADAGGLVLITPPAESSVALWADAMVSAFGLSWRIAREPIAYEPPRPLAAEQPDTPLLAFIGAEIDALASSVRINRALPLEALPDDAQALLTIDAPTGPTPLLLVAPPGGGDEDDRPRGGQSRGLLAYLSVAVDLNWSDLPAKPLMVPLIQELLRQGVGAAAGGGASMAGRTPDLPAGATTTNAEPPARQPISAQLAGDDPSIDDSGVIVRAGLYTALDASGRPVAPIAVNADRRAGDVAGNQPEGVREWLAGLLPPGVDASTRVLLVEPGGFTERGDAESTASGGAFALLLLALLAALLETVLARLFSHAQRDTPGLQSAETAMRPSAGKGAEA